MEYKVFRDVISVKAELVKDSCSFDYDQAINQVMVEFQEHLNDIAKEGWDIIKIEGEGLHKTTTVDYEDYWNYEYILITKRETIEIIQHDEKK
jgi:hypothetical protein